MKQLFSWMIFTCLLSACANSSSVNNEISSMSATDLPENLTIVFYNVENLFDTYDDPLTDDNDFLPNSSKAWNQERYYKKIDNLAEVLTNINSADWPAIIGLAEVENQVVLEDLIAHNDLINAGYEIVHYESPDMRGIDVALLYRKEYFQVENSESIEIDFSFNPDIKTRGLLHVEGSFANGSFFHFFVNHWPSRRDGADETEPKRIEVAKVLKEQINQIEENDPNANIFIMGDFNDFPTNKSISEILNAGIDDSQDLYNLAYEAHEADKGSIRYKGDWQLIDQMIVSKKLMKESSLQVKGESLMIYDDKSILYYDTKYDEYKPNRTYGGNNYYGGYSDHLPIYIELTIND